MGNWKILVILSTVSFLSCSIVANVDDLEPADNLFTSGSTCNDDAECGSNGLCPKILDVIENEEGVETESYCYLDCAENASICSGTSQPNCFYFFTEAFCLSKILVSGGLNCQQREANNILPPQNSNITVTFTQEETTLKLDRCEYWVESGSMHLSLTGASQTVVSAIFLNWPNVFDRKTTITSAEGTFIELSDLTAESAQQITIKGFFPSSEGSISLENYFLKAGDTIRGSMSITGYAYKATLDPSHYPSLTSKQR